MKKLMPVLLVSLLVLFVAPPNLLADGGFVVSKFVWDKHNDIAEPTQKAILVYDAGREDLILQVKYEGPVDEFGWLIPVPNLPTVQKGSMKCFYELSKYTQKLWERPVYKTRGDSIYLSGAGDYGKSEPPVKVIEIKTVGAYEIAVLSTKDSEALTKWLDANQFYFPTNKTDVLDAYVKQQWYFVAARINLGKNDGFKLVAESPKGREAPKSNHSTELKELANGELNPLQISFASDRCIFPLKISSVNDKPSEVQVYVLSPEPLVERTMLEIKLPAIYSAHLGREKSAAEERERMRLMQRNLQMRFMGETPPPDSPPPVERAKGLGRTSDSAAVDPEDLMPLPYAKVTKADLPESCEWIPRLANKSWWLTKRTWTFKPEEMRDLAFEPAIPYFINLLDSKYSFYAAGSLTPFGSDALPAILAAIHDTNPTVRVNAVGAIFEQGVFPVHDARLTEAALTWLKDPAPEVRRAAISILTDYLNWKPEFAERLVPMLRDKDARVRGAAVFGLPRFGTDIGKFIPTFQELLKDEDLGVRTAGLDILQRLRVEIPREDLLPFFKSSDPEAFARAFSQLRDQDEKLSDDDALPLLQNSHRVARLLGLRALDQNPEKQSVELALPLLKDSDELVRVKAAQTLRGLTGQHIPSDQPDQWVKWWTANKTNFIVQLHPEELRPQFPAPTGGGGERPSPFPRPKNFPR